MNYQSTSKLYFSHPSRHLSLSLSTPPFELSHQRICLKTIESITATQDRLPSLDGMTRNPQLFHVLARKGTVIPIGESIRHCGAQLHSFSAPRTTLSSLLNQNHNL
jgi:hypothetical protein